MKVMGVNLWAVLVSALATMAIGFVWVGVLPPLFHDAAWARRVRNVVIPRSCRRLDRRGG